MSDSITRGRRSTAVILGIVSLLTLALVYAAIAALFGFLFSAFPSTITPVSEMSAKLDFRGGTIVHIGEMRLYSEFSLNGLLVFTPLCLLSAYGGLASIRRWSGWAPVAQAAGWATVALDFGRSSP